MPPRAQGRRQPYDDVEALRAIRAQQGSSYPRQDRLQVRGSSEEDDEAEEGEEEESGEGDGVAEDGDEEDGLPRTSSGRRVRRVVVDDEASEDEEDSSEEEERRRQEEEDDDEDDDDEDDDEESALQEDQDDDDDDYDGTSGRAGRKRKAPARSKKAWRRLTVEEREAVTMEGGIVWEEANSIFASLNKRQRMAAQEMLSDVLTYVDRELERVVIPPTIRMPHASTGGAAAMGLASTSAVGSSLGSMMSWRAERGGILRADQGDDPSAARPDQNGFMADIRTLENLLRPEAAEILSMEQGLLEQQAELDRYKSMLSSLQKDRQERRRRGGADTRETRRKLRARIEELSRPSESEASTQATPLPITVDAALRESAAASIKAAR